MYFLINYPRCKILKSKSIVPKFCHEIIMLTHHPKKPFTMGAFPSVICPTLSFLVSFDNR